MVIIQYWCSLYSGIIVGVGSKGHSDSGWGLVAVWPDREGSLLDFQSRQAAIDWLKREVRPDTILAETEAEFLAATTPAVYIQERVYPGPNRPLREATHVAVVGPWSRL